MQKNDDNIFVAACIEGNVARMSEMLAKEPDRANSCGAMPEENGKNQWSRGSARGWPALHLAAGHGHAAAVDLLLHYGASVSALSQNSLRNTALHAAVSGGDSHSVRLLILAGADIATRDFSGITPLDVARAAGNWVLTSLLERGSGLVEADGPDEEAVHPLDAREWRCWLRAHYHQKKSVWLVMYKKASGKTLFPIELAIPEALSFGWIDSLPRKLDEERTMLRFTPRKAGTGWSKVNKDHIDRMIAAGRMHPAGLAKIEAARADGSWNLLDSVDALEVPPDLRNALDAIPAASPFFDAFPRSARRGILEWIAQAKTTETRAKRVAETVDKAARNERANQWKPKTTIADTQNQTEE